MAVISPPAPTGLARVRTRLRQPIRPATTTPFLSTIIVNYRQWLGTGDLARSLLRSGAGRRGELEVMVVDNHSPAHPLARQLRRWAGVSLRRWRGNRGFARAVNEGHRLSRGQWALLLNPDVSITATFIEGVVSLASRLEIEEPRAGIVGFRLLNSDGSPQLSTGAFPTLGRTLAGLLRPRARRKHLPQTHRARCQVPWVTGCCVLVRRECLHELGGLDDDFFLYYEDVDLCRRAWERGWSVWHEPGLAATHHSPLHSRAVPPHLRVATRHALLTYAGKHWPTWQARLLAGIVRTEAYVRKLWALGQGDPDTARTFSGMGELARSLAAGRKEEARRQLRRVVRRQERRLAR